MEKTQLDKINCEIAKIDEQLAKLDITDLGGDRLVIWGLERRKGVLQSLRKLLQT